MIETRQHFERVQRRIERGEAARSSIAASWARMFNHHGMEPDQGAKTPRISGKELRLAREKRDLLRYIARPILENLFTAIGKAGYVIILTDQDSVVLDWLVRDAERKDFASIGVYSGGVFSEKVQGTNGMGTVLYEERPLIVHKQDHYLVKFFPASCIGAPLFDENGQIMGVVDVSSVREDCSKEMARLLLQLVINAAAQIESEYFRAKYASRKIFVADGFSAQGMPLLALDQYDMIVGANRTARKMFNLDPKGLDKPVSEIMRRPTEEAHMTFLDAERAALKNGIRKARGNMTEAARLLGVSRATFYRMIKKHKLNEKSVSDVRHN